MRVCFINTFYDDEFKIKQLTGQQVLQRYHLNLYLPEAIGNAGCHTTVLQHFYRNELITGKEVRFEFVKPGLIPRLTGRFFALFFNKFGESYFQPVTRILRRLESLQPDIVHFFGLTLIPNLWLVIKWAVARNVVTVVHYHGGAPARRWPVKIFESYILKQVNCVLFTCREQTAEWLQAGLVPEKIRYVVETSSHFKPIAKSKARKIAGLQGDPVFVSAGRLNSIKDPLTILDGFEKIVRALPQARLFLYYRSTELLAEMENKVAASPDLKGRVSFNGEADHSEMASIFSSADFVLQASLREFSGCAILEAMACGAIPVVSNIPSFRAITENGRLGLLFPPGDPDTMAEKVIQMTNKERSTLSKNILKKFVNDLSYPAMANNIIHIYDELISQTS
jgi:glycosyltransferase involved in cell wall biosynthesis